MRKASAQALGNLGDSQATPHLVEVLKDYGWLIRLNAAEALGRIGDSSVLPALKEYLRTARYAIEQETIQRAIQQITQKQRESSKR